MSAVLAVFFFFSSWTGPVRPPRPPGPPRPGHTSPGFWPWGACPPPQGRGRFVEIGLGFLCFRHFDQERFFTLGAADPFTHQRRVFQSQPALTMGTDTIKGGSHVIAPVEKWVRVIAGAQ